MHCVLTILKTLMNRITNSNRCRIIRQLWECSNVTISQSWIAALSLSHVAMYLTCTCTDSTSIWGVARHYLFTVLNAALSLPHVAMYLTCTYTDSTPTEGVLKSYHFTVVNGRTCTSVLRASRCAGVSTLYLYSMPQYINWGSV